MVKLLDTTGTSRGMMMQMFHTLIDSLISAQDFHRGNKLWEGDASRRVGFCSEWRAVCECDHRMGSGSTGLQWVPQNRLHMSGRTRVGRWL